MSLGGRAIDQIGVLTRPVKGTQHWLRYWQTTREVKRSARKDSTEFFIIDCWKLKIQQGCPTWKNCTDKITRTLPVERSRQTWTVLNKDCKTISTESNQKARREKHFHDIQTHSVMLDIANMKGFRGKVSTHPTFKIGLVRVLSWREGSLTP